MLCPLKEGVCASVIRAASWRRRTCAAIKHFQRVPGPMLSPMASVVPRRGDLQKSWGVPWERPAAPGQSPAGAPHHFRQPAWYLRICTCRLRNLPQHQEALPVLTPGCHKQGREPDGPTLVNAFAWRSSRRSQLHGWGWGRQAVPDCGPTSRTTPQEVVGVESLDIPGLTLCRGWDMCLQWPVFSQTHC